MSDTPQEPTQEVQATRKPMTVRENLQTIEFQEQVKMALPIGFSPEKFVRVSLNALARNPDIAKCSPQSVFRCLLDLASLGLEADGRRAHLIPFGKVTPICTLIIDYKGLVELALRSGNIAKIHADIVCENDTFQHDCGEIKTHTYDIGKPRGKMIGVFVETVTKDGIRQASIMSKAEVDAIRARSRSGQSGPWVTDYNEQAKKTVFRRHSKWIVLSPEIRSAMAIDDSDYESPPERRIVSSAENDPLLAELTAEGK